MKNFIYLVLTVLIVACSGNDSSDSESDNNGDNNPPQELTYVPDDAFEERLIIFGYDDVMDNYVLTDNIKNRSHLSLAPNIGLVDLTGIEDFQMLQYLNISNNPVTSLDLSNNLYIDWLILDHCNLSYLNVANGQQFGNNAPNNSNDWDKMNTTFNPNLFCVKVDKGVYQPYNGGYGMDFDSQTVWSVDCD